MGFGDELQDPNNPLSGPLPETVRVLDSIAVEFIRETCLNAGQIANWSGRQKVKLDDFRYILRKDAVKLGRVNEILQAERELKETRKLVDDDGSKVGKGQAAELAKEEMGKEKDKGKEKDGEGEDGPPRKKRRRASNK